MTLRFEDKEYIEIEFKRNLNWFEEEFDLIFGGSNPSKFTKKEKRVANRLLDQLSETINKYNDEELLYFLVKSLNKIEKKYPDLF